ncbi:MAG TPA: AraC family transcriptional regulator [Rhizomicrobium sp.]
MDGVTFFRASIGGAFSKALEAGNYAYCVMLRTGRMRLDIDFPVPAEIELGPGDGVAVSGLTPHSFHSLGKAAPAAIGRFDRLPVSGSGARSDVELIIGVAPSEALALGSLMVGPIVVKAQQHPDLARRLWGAVEMLEDEYANDFWIDRSLVIRRLAEIMTINMSRRVFAERRVGGPGGAASHQIMLAIRAFFSKPGKAWTLPDLAKAAGMSRTRFAEEFRRATGQTPAHIISRMRLTAVARQLATTPLSVDAAAEAAGYGSSAAFVRAFQREFGQTPARWRRHRAARNPRENEHRVSL